FDPDLAPLEQAAHGIGQCGLSDLCHFSLPLLGEDAWGVGRACAVIDVAAGQGEASEQLHEDMLGLAFGFAFAGEGGPCWLGKSQGMMTPTSSEFGRSTLMNLRQVADFAGGELLAFARSTRK